MQGNQLVQTLCEQELAALRSGCQAGHAANHLKSLDERGRAQELVRDQYSGRYPFELLQNADDAMATQGRRGKVRLILTGQALLVGNSGQTFGQAEIEAICGLGRSPKDASTSIGYKGLGFKSVAEISDEPQIISGDERFYFSARRSRTEVQKIAGVLKPTQHLPSYAFPWPLSEEGLGEDAAVVRDLVDSGFETIIRLPLKPGVAREEVAAAVQSTLSPRQLLFLRSVDAVTFEDVEDARSNWSVSASRRRSAGEVVVELTTNAQPERWLVFARRVKVERRLTRPLGVAWRKVKDVACTVAVQLGAKGIVPLAALDARIHAYFPTEEATGLPFVVHGDFALELDRRRVARTREAVAYNHWLCQKIATLAGTTVAPDLAARPGASALVVTALLSHDVARGETGAQLRRFCLDQFASATWLSKGDGHLCKPSQAALLPISLAGLPANEFLREKAAKSLLARALQDLDASANLLSLVGVKRWNIDQVVASLRPPSAGNYKKFWQFLLAWHARTPGVEKSLAQQPWLLCLDGTWRAASSGPYLPRQKEVILPAGIPVPVVEMPLRNDVGLRSLLTAIGVKDFSWRELALGTLIPLLKKPTASADVRARALAGLAAYLKQSQRQGDEKVDAAVGHVLLYARRADDDVRVLRPANTLYVGPAHANHDRLLKIYGPFGRVEFLAEDPETLQAAAGADVLKFFQWLGGLLVHESTWRSRSR